jgi:hypothetical protein
MIDRAPDSTGWLIVFYGFFGFWISDLDFDFIDIDFAIKKDNSR